MSPSTDTRENRQLASEIKFLVSRAVAAQIQAWARAQLLPDPHASGTAGDDYTVTSLYFDTAQFDVFHRRGSFGRSKYRIRRYGESVTVFLERKLKTRRVLTKRRSVIPIAELDWVSAAESGSEWSGSWFQRRLLARGLSPVCQISYERTARVAMTQYGPIRLTLDDNLCASRAPGLWFNDTLGAPLLQDRLILELKFRFALPAKFKYLLEEFTLTPQPFSKYRLAAAALGLVTPEPSLQKETHAYEPA